MKIASNTLEMRILRTLTAGRKTNAIINVLDPTCFNGEISKELYNRITTLAQQRGIITTWGELQIDPAISESTRKILLNYKKKPIKSKDLLDRYIGNLHKYRDLRALFEAQEYILDSLNKDKIVDQQDIINKAVGILQNVGINKHDKSPYIDIGGNDKAALKIIKNLLKDSKDSYIPTGFKEFDDRNVGIPRGSFFMLQSNSSGGKSVAANQIVAHAARQGYRACLVPLEMTGNENARRHVARVTETDMTEVNDPKKLSTPRKKEITEQWMKWHGEIKKAGGLLRIYPPQEDMTLLQILLELQPFKFDLIIIDYLGLLKGNDGENQARNMGADGRFAKRYAVKHNMAVGACAQLSEDNKVRYSRALNEHSNLSFSWQYGDKEREHGIAMFELPKARNQDARPFYMKAKFNHMKFEAIDETEAKSIQGKTPEPEKNDTKAKGKFKATSKEDRNKEKAKKEQRQKDRKIVSEDDYIK